MRPKVSSRTGEQMHRGEGSMLRRLAGNPREHPSVRVLLRLLYAYAPVVLVTNAINGALIVFVFWNVVAKHLLIVWYVLLLATVVARARSWKRYRREPAGGRPVARWGDLAAVGSGASASSGGPLARSFSCRTRRFTIRSWRSCSAAWRPER